MKQLILIVLFFTPHLDFSQEKIQVIKATTKSALIKTSNNEEVSWNLSPEINPDVYEMPKSPEVSWIKFCTDVDSLKIDLKPGQKFDFVVLLNGKDSCFTRLERPALKNFSELKPEIHDTIPFILTGFNNIKLKVVLDGADTLDLKFDSGTSDFLLTRDVLKNKLRLHELNGHTFQIGNMKWEQQQIYAVELSGQETVGRFGWNLFDGKIVEIDYDKNLFIIHSKLSAPGKGYEEFKIFYSYTLFCIEAELQIKGRKFKNRFLFDNGYQRTIMLDEQLMKEQNYPKDSLEIIKKVIMQNGQGKEIPVITVNNEKLNLGKYTLQNVPVQLLSSNNPAGTKVHILGNEVLKRFNTILDFQKNKVYLKPNKLYDLPYAESR